LTNSFFLGNVSSTMFAQFIAGLKKEKRAKIRRDVLTEQVKKVLEDSDQKLILMVRG